MSPLTGREDVSKRHPCRDWSTVANQPSPTAPQSPASSTIRLAIRAATLIGSRPLGQVSTETGKALVLAQPLGLPLPLPPALLDALLPFPLLPALLAPLLPFPLLPALLAPLLPFPLPPALLDPLLPLPLPPALLDPLLPLPLPPALLEPLLPLPLPPALLDFPLALLLPLLMPTALPLPLLQALLAFPLVRLALFWLRSAALSLPLPRPLLGRVVSVVVPLMTGTPSKLHTDLVPMPSTSSGVSVVTVASCPGRMSLTRSLMVSCTCTTPRLTSTLAPRWSERTVNRVPLTTAARNGVCTEKC